MSGRSLSLRIAWRELVRELRSYVRDGLSLARCRLTGGHQFGTWRFLDEKAFNHTWCRRCGWCQNVQSFDEERIGAREGWYEGVETRS